MNWKNKIYDIEELIEVFSINQSIEVEELQYKII